MRGGVRNSRVMSLFTSLGGGQGSGSELYRKWKQEKSLKQETKYGSSNIKKKARGIISHYNSQEDLFRCRNYDEISFKSIDANFPRHLYQSKDFLMQFNLEIDFQSFASVDLSKSHHGKGQEENWLLEDGRAYKGIGKGSESWS